MKLSRVNPDQNDLGKDCPICLHAIYPPTLEPNNQVAVFHAELEGKKHPLHETCIRDYALKIKKNIPPCPICRKEINIRSLFSWSEQIHQSTRKFLEYAIPTTLSAAAAGIAGIAALNIAAKITPTVILQEVTAIGKASQLFLAMGAVAGEIAVREEVALTMPALAAIYMTIAFKASAAGISQIIAQGLAGHGIITAGTVAGSAAGVVLRFTAEKMGKDLSIIRWGVEAGTCAGLLFVTTSNSIPIALATMIATGGIFAGISAALR